MAGKKNGELLSLAEKSGFDVFLTLDRGTAVRTEPATQNHRDYHNQF